MSFRDLLDIRVTAGDGGHGSISLRREKFVRFGGPDGGDGGRGGDVTLRAVDDVTSLAALVDRRQFRAGNAEPGEGRKRSGADGKSLVIDVPVGTVALDLASGEVLADLTEVGQTAVIAKGGDGGRGNRRFASSVRQTPRFAEAGTPGQSRRIRLELRLIADAGLVGYPNAGKSSLLRALTAARAEVAPYPFTTLSPQLGVLPGEDRQLVLADLPGIISGASEGRGLGLEFLRHISRTRALLYVIATVDDQGVEANVVRVLEELQVELHAYDPALLALPALIALNKADLIDQALLRRQADDLSLSGLPVTPTSALQGTGLDRLTEALFALVGPTRQLAPARAGPRLVKAPPPVRVKRAPDGVFLASGGELEEKLQRFDPYNLDAAQWLQGFFRKSGLNARLEAAGARPGDTVRIAGVDFEYHPDGNQPQRRRRGK